MLKRSHSWLFSIREIEKVESSGELGVQGTGIMSFLVNNMHPDNAIIFLLSSQQPEFGGYP